MQAFDVLFTILCCTCMVTATYGIFEARKDFAIAKRKEEEARLERCKLEIEEKRYHVFADIDINKR